MMEFGRIAQVGGSVEQDEEVARAVLDAFKAAGTAR
jgi:hypothetical protein